MMTNSKFTCFYKALLLMIFSWAFYFSKAQSIQEIMGSDKYYWGEGLDKNERNADRQAIQNFTINISEVLSDRFLKLAKDKNTVKQITRSALETFANSKFKELDRKKEVNPNSILVVRYIDKENLLEALFYDREIQIHEYYDKGVKAQKENRLVDALQQYYWSFLLLNTHPYNQTISIDENSTRIPLIQYLPSKINQIFNSLKFEVENIKFEDDNKSGIIVLNITTDNQPVESLSFKYKLNNEWYSTACKNGKGVIRFEDKNSLNNGSILIEVEYHFEEEAQIDREVSDVFETFYQIPEFERAEFKLPIDNAYLLNNENETNTANSFSHISIDPVDDEDCVSAIKNSILKIINAIDRKDYISIRNEFTEEGWNDFNSLVKYGNARLLSNNPNLKVRQINQEFVVRKVPISFHFKNYGKEFVEDLVFYVDSIQHKVSGLSFSISQVAINDILNHTDEWGSNQDKWQLVNFMENYKTAYCLKRLDFIEQIFAEDALIIVGRNLRSTVSQNPENSISIYGDNAEYIKKSKSEYIKSLRMVFNSNEFINVHFEDNLVKRRNADEKVFGIQIAQYYTSTRYSDKGYLFLMLDLKDSLNPKIYVRTWQPEKNPDGTIFGLNDFHF